MTFSDTMRNVTGPARVAVAQTQPVPRYFKRALPTLVAGCGVVGDDGKFGGGCFAVAGQIEDIAITNHAAKPKGKFELQVVNVDGSADAISFDLAQSTYNRQGRLDFKRGATFFLFFTPAEVQEVPYSISWGLSVRPYAQTLDLMQEVEYA